MGLFLALFVHGCFAVQNDDGNNYGHFNSGIMMLMAVVFISNFSIIYKTSRISIFSIFTLIISNGVFVLLWVIFTSFENQNLYKSFSKLTENYNFYVFLFVIAGLIFFDMMCDKIYKELMIDPYNPLITRKTSKGLNTNPKIHIELPQ